MRENSSCLKCNRRTPRLRLPVLGCLVFVLLSPCLTARERDAADDPILEVWRRLENQPVTPLRNEARDSDCNVPVESLTVYPMAAQPLTSTLSADNRQLLLEEVQRRLARLQAGSAAVGNGSQNQVPPLQQGMPPATIVGKPAGRDTTDRLELYQPQQDVKPARADASLAPIAPIGSPGKAVAALADNTAEWSIAWPDNLLAGPVRSPPVRTRSVPIAQNAAADVTVATPAKIEKVPLEPPAAENRYEPNLSPSPQAQAAFDRHFQAGQLYQQEGQYPRAADAFTLALAFRPNDPRAHLGKGHALFASGDYLGSASELARAIELDVDVGCALHTGGEMMGGAHPTKVDLVQIAGGADPFLARFNDLDHLAKTKPSAQLQFLLAYVYYEMGRSQEAKTAIEAAREGSTWPASVEILRTAINR